jgi:hypothetical protein
MSSQNHLTETQIGAIKNCTTVSTFIKSNSLKFELLFGDYYKKIARVSEDKKIILATDYLFLPEKIFGFYYESLGTDFKKMHHALVLGSCWSGEVGDVVPGINPGTEILISTLTSAASLRLKTILQKLEKNKVDLAKISIKNYHRLNHLLEIKGNTEFFVGEIS